jgi:ABC-type lipoprotein export system ATPase subunit
MVTHDLRMMKCVEKVIQMVDGSIEWVITDRADINRLAGTSEFDRLDKQAGPIRQEQLVIHSEPQQYARVPAFTGAD